MEFKDYLKQQAVLHPAMEPQDAMKMCYQAAFGAEHLLSDVEAAKGYFDEEFENVPACAGTTLYENISEDICRVNLGAWKAAGLPGDWLFKIFLISARENCEDDDVRGMVGGGEEAFHSNLRAAGKAAEEGLMPFGSEQWCKFEEKYLAGGIRAVHHSKNYRACEKPAYRLADRKLMRLIPVLEKMAQFEDSACPPWAAQAESATQSEGSGPSCCVERPEGGGPSMALAIDGRAASGKSTTAAWLKEIVGGQVVRMDDFFLPPHLRTAERLSTPGGNVHYERFAEEVLPHLKSGENFTYTRFDCSVMDFDSQPVQVPAARWLIVEGSYSHHPKLGEYADIKVFSTVEPEEQMARIVRRNGTEMAEVFKSRWIPMEEEYFCSFDIAGEADVVI